MDDEQGWHGPRLAGRHPYDGGMKTRLQCPCGEIITAADEDELVEKTQAHLAEKHPGMTYGREEILFIAT